MTPNWFIALPVPDTGWLGPLLARRPECLRPFVAADLHVTIAFLGPVGEERARAAWEVARAVPRPTFGLVLGPLRGFGPRGRPSAWSVVPASGSAALEAWMSDHGGAMYRACGLPEDSRPPRPHVTVARPRRRATAEERRQAARWAAEAPPVDRPVDLATLALYTWSDDRRERQFRIVDSTSNPPSA